MLSYSTAKVESETCPYCASMPGWSKTFTADTKFASFCAEYEGIQKSTDEKKWICPHNLTLMPISKGEMISFPFIMAVTVAGKSLDIRLHPSYIKGEATVENYTLTSSLWNQFFFQLEQYYYSNPRNGTRSVQLGTFYNRPYDPNPLMEDLCNFSDIYVILKYGSTHILHKLPDLKCNFDNHKYFQSNYLGINIDDIDPHESLPRNTYLELIWILESDFQVLVQFGRTHITGKGKSGEEAKEGYIQIIFVLLLVLSCLIIGICISCKKYNQPSRKSMEIDSINATYVTLTNIQPFDQPSIGTNTSNTKDPSVPAKSVGFLTFHNQK
eukprot:TRINITY_DN13572_c0_g1_i2.p1 TRINITY_DN13572_c0_g1~~TRINITY_DN13572_c0_g1_i2.p1  ORF type:complete len:326 (-),score=22.49 TRINITY_DN13572_c0_g1_i2:128-1105(-)